MSWHPPSPVWTDSYRGSKGTEWPALSYLHCDSQSISSSFLQPLKPVLHLNPLLLLLLLREPRFHDSINTHVNVPILSLRSWPIFLMISTKTILEPLLKVTNIFILTLGLQFLVSTQAFIPLYLSVIKLLVPHNAMKTLLAEVTNNILMVKFNQLSS